MKPDPLTTLAKLREMRRQRQLRSFAEVLRVSTELERHQAELTLRHTEQADRLRAALAPGRADVDAASAARYQLAMLQEQQGQLRGGQAEIAGRLQTARTALCQADAGMRALEELLRSRREIERRAAERQADREATDRHATLSHATTLGSMTTASGEQP